MTDHLKSAPVAYQNEPFLDSPDGRILRILAEYQEPLARFRREQIQDTVVFFGSARFQGVKDAANTLKAIEQNHATAPAAELEKDLKRANAGLDMARYYEDARPLALHLQLPLAQHPIQYVPPAVTSPSQHFSRRKFRFAYLPKRLRFFPLG